MALAFCVDHPDALGEAFAAHDEYLAIFSHFVRSDDDEKIRMLTPKDDYYTAPFCFMPRNDNSNITSGFLVFTAQVPWLHGSPTKGGDDRAHHQAQAWMRERGAMDPPIIGTVEDFQRRLCLNDERGLFTFTEDGCYPSPEDISQALGK